MNLVIYRLKRNISLKVIDHIEQYFDFCFFYTSDIVCKVKYAYVNVRIYAKLCNNMTSKSGYCIASYNVMTYPNEAKKIIK